MSAIVNYEQKRFLETFKTPVRAFKSEDEPGWTISLMGFSMTAPTKRSVEAVIGAAVMFANAPGLERVVEVWIDNNRRLAVEFVFLETRSCVFYFLPDATLAVVVTAKITTRRGLCLTATAYDSDSRLQIIELIKSHTIA